MKWFVLENFKKNNNNSIFNQMIKITNKSNSRSWFKKKKKEKLPIRFIDLT